MLRKKSKEMTEKVAFYVNKYISAQREGMLLVIVETITLRKWYSIKTAKTKTLPMIVCIQTTKVYFL